MNRLRIFILFWTISLFGIPLDAQQDSLHLEANTVLTVKDSLELSERHRKAGIVFVGADLYSLALSGFSDRQGGAAFISYRVFNKWNMVAEVGYESNNYKDLDWLVDVNGIYFKLGFNWFISQDHQDNSNGFYTGARISYSAYQQQIKQYPVRLSNNQVDEYGSLPAENVSAYWFEMVAGGRIKLISNLYANVSVRPMIYMGSKKQENIEPLVIPAYGKDRGPINFTIIWGLSWKLF